MKIKILIIINALMLFLICLSLVSATPFYYKLSMNYDKGKINISSAEIIFSQDELSDNNGDYFLEILDFNNNKISSFNFYVPNKIAYDEGNNEGKIISGGIIIFNQTSFEIFIPYYENAKEIVIYDNKNIELDKTDVSSYSKTKEFSKEGEEAKQAQEKQAEETGENFNDKIKNNSNYLVIGLVILLIMLIIILINKTKKKK